MESVNLTHHFLIAMPGMVDPNFSKTLTYICEHNEQGALGLVVNRPIDLRLDALFEQISIPVSEDKYSAMPVHFGGPVQIDRGFVLHNPLGDWQSTLAVNREVGLTTSKDILQALSDGRGPRRVLVTLGYAGWAPGQLEQELGQNAWLTVPANAEVIFDTPPELRLSAAMGLLGVDFATLSGHAGHA
ncbi:MAG: YqgE/AlgH family protein [Burkholderiales bacterium]|nr:YqgE/AlgH family protein [Burkholderiales bacterium]MDQ3196542.1 YqgE/AlgH family protein [Pseudomonadota bacterium]